MILFKTNLMIFAGSGACLDFFLLYGMYYGMKKTVLIIIYLLLCAAGVIILKVYGREQVLRKNHNGLIPQVAVCSYVKAKE